MDSDDRDKLIKHVKRTVRLANRAQTVSDVAHELGELDVDLPWRKRPDVETEADKRKKAKEDIGAEEGGVEESHLSRNLLIGAGIGAIWLFFRKRFDGRKAMSAMTFLTKDFRIREYLVSSEIPEIKSYPMTQGELRNVTRNAIVLQAGRDAYGFPFFITSGIRPVALRARDGKYKGLSLVEILKEKGYAPASFSQHMDGSAADFTVERKEDLEQIYKWFWQASQPGGMFDKVITQLIIYVNDGNLDFIHLGVVSDVNKFNVTPENRYLVAVSLTAIDEHGNKRRVTKYSTYSLDILNAALGRRLES